MNDRSKTRARQDADEEWGRMSSAAKPEPQPDPAEVDWDETLTKLDDLVADLQNAALRDEKAGRLPPRDREHERQRLAPLMVELCRRSAHMLQQVRPLVRAEVYTPGPPPE